MIISNNIIFLNKLENECKNNNFDEVINIILNCFNNIIRYNNNNINNILIQQNYNYVNIIKYNKKDYFVKYNNNDIKLTFPLITNLSFGILNFEEDELYEQEPEYNWFYDFTNNDVIINNKEYYGTFRLGDVLNKNLYSNIKFYNYNKLNI